MQTLKVHSGPLTAAVKIVRMGERYGLDGCLVHDSEKPLVEFYDADHAGDKRFAPEGQFISRYYAETLLERSTGGLDLYGGEPKWKLDDEAMDLVRNWVRQQLVSGTDLQPA